MTSSGIHPAYISLCGGPLRLTGPLSDIQIGWLIDYFLRFALQPSLDQGLIPQLSSPVTEEEGDLEAKREARRQRREAE